MAVQRSRNDQTADFVVRSKASTLLQFHHELGLVLVNQLGDAQAEETKQVPLRQIEERQMVLVDRAGSWTREPIQDIRGGQEQLEVRACKDKVFLMVERRAEVHDVVMRIEGMFMFFRSPEVIENDSVDADRNFDHMRRVVGGEPVCDGKQIVLDLRSGSGGVVVVELAGTAVCDIRSDIFGQ